MFTRLTIIIFNLGHPTPIIIFSMYKYAHISPSRTQFVLHSRILQSHNTAYYHTYLHHLYTIIIHLLSPLFTYLIKPLHTYLHPYLHPTPSIITLFAHFTLYIRTYALTFLLIPLIYPYLHS